jgi:hypothetical protein
MKESIEIKEKQINMWYCKWQKSFSKIIFMLFICKNKRKFKSFKTKSHVLYKKFYHTSTTNLAGIWGETSNNLCQIKFNILSLLK